ncbi:putative RING-H2 finger protein ATL21A [Durio zibethinus]|uniref:RING-H2 finger protein ATL21A n=1 Tax=Durio zibethinus TaxID=66656 RepID=A0A6P5XC28_DURZI|nr:putative RING-H2 finger protein ATL21A [Durio zibethinus]
MRNPQLLSFSIALKFSLFIFLFIFPIQARKTPQICSSSCGDIKNISYPFRLKGDPADCGDPDYELYCENNKTILNFHAGLYYVKRISYDERIIRLVDINLASGSCSLPYRSLGIDEVMGDGRYNSEYLHPHATFVRCSEEINNMASSRVPCLSGNTSQIYVNYTDYRLYYPDIPSSCNIISMVLTDHPDDKLNFPSNYEAIRQILQLGFDLNWTVECRDCTARGGYCQFPTDKSRAFQCKKEEDSATQIRRAIIYLFSIFLFGLIIFFRFILAPLVVFVFILHKCFSRR